MSREKSSASARSLRQRPRAARPPDPYLAGLRVLARREVSTAQLRERLSRRGYDPRATEAAIERLLAERALDDHRTAVAFARTAAHVRGLGRTRVLRELAQLGIDPEIVRTTLAAVFDEIDEATVLTGVIDRKLRGTKPGPRALERLRQTLVRRGFATDAIREALRPWKPPREPDLPD